MKQIEIYDTTLRDGGQDPKIDFSIEDKLKLIPIIDSFGADFIEVGFASNNKAENKLYQTNTNTSMLVAFGSTANPKNINDMSNDKSLVDIINTGTKFATIFGKSDPLHALALFEKHIAKEIDDKLNYAKQKNLEIIEKSVRYLTEHGIEVIYDAEHFFLGFDNDTKYALDTLKAAIKGGSKRIVLCDTTGGMIPKDVRRVVEKIKHEFSSKEYDNLIWGIHCHEDSGCSTSNSLEFVDEILKFKDNVHIQGTFNGYGERAGNAPINIIAANIKFKLGYDLSNIDFSNLTKISQEIALTAKVPLPPNTPYVGRYAFAHKAGLHIFSDRVGASYNHIDPREVGNESRYLLTSQAGKDALIWFASKYGYKLNKKDQSTKDLLEIAKNLSREGYDLNISDAVGKLFMLRYHNKIMDRFNLASDYETTSKTKGNNNISKTIIYSGNIIGQNGQKHEIDKTFETSEDGPVDSQFKAIKNTVSKYYPIANNVSMDYFETDVPPVRNKNEDYSKSKVLTIIGFNDGKIHWSTIGLNKSRDDASIMAIKDGFEYYINAIEENL